MFRYFEHLEEVDSTSDYLKQFIGQGVPRVAVARRQTAGRGRYGREWFSSPDKGFYVSYLFFPPWETAWAEMLNVVPCLTLMRVMRKLAPERRDIRLKKPNDLLIGDRKAAGILSELGSMGGRIEWALVGLGLNLTHEEFPGELQETATSLRMEGIRVPKRLHLLEMITAGLTLLLPLVPSRMEELKEEFEEGTV